jgi:Tol biopolymer transport system component
MTNDPRDQLVPAPSTRPRDTRRPPITLARVVSFVFLVAMSGLGLALLAVLDLPTGSGVAAAPSLTPTPAQTSEGTGPTDDPGDVTPVPLGPTPDASVVVTAPPEDRAKVRGTILFVRTGDIWAVTGEALHRLSGKGRDSWPVWSADGNRIYFIQTRTKVSEAPYQGRYSKITLYYPTIMSMAADGTDRQTILSTLFDIIGGPAGAKYFNHALQMDVSPDGKTFALISDAPNAFVTDAVLATLPVKGGDIKNLGVKDEKAYGHNDPDWSPDGHQIAFTYNGRSGSIGVPSVAMYTTSTKQLRMVGRKGYGNPSWSPDGRYLVVEKTDGKGRDIAILDAATGELANRLTLDGNSFAPVFSPDGTQIAYLRVAGQDIDLRILTLAPDGSLHVIDDKAITHDGSIDAESSLSWTFPDELRSTIPTPAPPGSPEPSDSGTAPASAPASATAGASASVSPAP